MGYYPDLSKISLDFFKNRLKSQVLVSSQMILRDNIEDRFDILKKQNINNMEQLQQALKTKNDVEVFARESSLPVKYLTVLRREVNSYNSQKRKLKDFKILNNEIKKILDTAGIKTAEELYLRVRNKNERKKLAVLIKATDEELLFLTRLSDFSRLRYVTPEFSALLANSKFDTVEKLNEADPYKLYENLLEVNGQNRFFKGKIDKKYMQYLIDDSVLVSFDIEY
jgi:hypothetical protein